MTAAAKLAAVITGIVIALLIIGCSPATPDREDVAERFGIEHDAALGSDMMSVTPAGRDLALGMADDMLDGACGSVPYRVGISEAGTSFVYAFEATCLMYFERDMSQRQIERAKLTVIERAVGGGS